MTVERSHIFKNAFLSDSCHYVTFIDHVKCPSLKRISQDTMEEMPVLASSLLSNPLQHMLNMMVTCVLTVNPALEFDQVMFPVTRIFAKSALFLNAAFLTCLNVCTAPP